MISGQRFSFSNFWNFRNLDIGFSINLKMILLLLLLLLSLLLLLLLLLFIIFIIIIITFFLHGEIGFSKPIYNVKMFLMKFF